MQVFKSFIVDLTKIGGKGEFQCQKCGMRISPDDQTEDTYVILEVAMKGDNLDKIALQCNKCQSHIYLTGFYLLNKTRA